MTPSDLLPKPPRLETDIFSVPPMSADAERAFLGVRRHDEDSKGRQYTDLFKCLACKRNYTSSVQFRR